MIIFKNDVSLQPNFSNKMVSKEENILLNAEKLFAEKGFDGTSTREISKAAQVNIAMISYYFGSKEKLFESIFEYRMKESFDIANSITQQTNLNAWEKMELIINSYVQRVQNLRNFYLILQREQINFKNPRIVQYIKKTKINFLEVYVEVIEKGVSDGTFHNVPPLEFIHSTISGTLFTAMNSFPVYQEFFKGKSDYEKTYYQQLNLHLKKILKHLLGYEEKI